jgi:hypothetical protein
MLLQELLVLSEVVRGGAKPQGGQGGGRLLNPGSLYHPIDPTVITDIRGPWSQHSKWEERWSCTREILAEGFLIRCVCQTDSLEVAPNRILMEVTRVPGLPNARPGVCRIVL